MEKSIFAIALCFQTEVHTSRKMILCSRTPLRILEMVTQAMIISAPTITPCPHDSTMKASMVACFRHDPGSPSSVRGTRIPCSVGKEGAISASMIEKTWYKIELECGGRSSCLYGTGMSQVILIEGMKHLLLFTPPIQELISVVHGSLACVLDSQKRRDEFNPGDGSEEKVWER